MLIPDVIKEIMVSLREDYCFLANHLCVLIMMLALIYLDDERSKRLLTPLLVGLIMLIYPFHAWYIYTSWDVESYRTMINFLYMPIVAAYTIYCVSEKYEGKKKTAAIAIGAAIFIISCTLDHWTVDQFRFYKEPVETSSITNMEYAGYRTDNMLSSDKTETETALIKKSETVITSAKASSETSKAHTGKAQPWM